MPNPLRGEVMIKIGGSEYSLIFSHDAIASIEAEFNESILDVQHKFSMAGVRLFVLMAVTGLDKATCSGSKIPPIFETIETLNKALHVAYFGAEFTNEMVAEPEESTQKKTQSRSKPQ